MRMPLRENRAVRIVPQWAVAELCGTLAGLSRVYLCSPVLDDRNGRPATQVFDQLAANRIRQLQIRFSCRDSQLPRRVALTRRMSAVRARHTHQDLPAPSSNAPEVREGVRVE